VLETEQVTIIFADAWVLHADALEELDRGKLRNAAEKAWGATKRATDALVLARTGNEPRSAGRTTRSIRALAVEDSAFRGLAVRYGDRAHILHGMCFYDGMCEPEEAVARDIRETAGYIRDAEGLAQAEVEL
jgi:hypothetical protein